MSKTNKPFCLLLLIGIFFITSCRTNYNAVYFSDLDSSGHRELTSPLFEEPLIQTDDILNITVQTIDPVASAAINQTPASVAQGSSQGQGAISGFLVDKNGNVEIPMLGVVKLAGLTTSLAKEVIRNKAQQYYKDPTVQVRFSNYKITVLGEVNKPASYTVPNEKVTILDAISLAGDLTIYGKRDNIMLIRELGGKKEIVRLDLTSSKLISSPYFYLKQNDVLYVEPADSKVKAANAPRTQLITVGISIVTLVITILTRF
jgi:polysaccharide export outer membrane protein